MGVVRAARQRRADGAGHTVYFGADSGWWEGFAEIGAEYGPFDLTLLEIGAYNELWKAIHMGPDGAAQAFQDMGGAGMLMPIHWGLFNLALHAWRGRWSDAATRRRGRSEAVGAGAGRADRSGARGRGAVGLVALRA